jgi:hypothetical protein
LLSFPLTEDVCVSHVFSQIFFFPALDTNENCEGVGCFVSPKNDGSAGGVGVAEVAQRMMERALDFDEVHLDEAPRECDTRLFGGVVEVLPRVGHRGASNAEAVDILDIAKGHTPDYNGYTLRIKGSNKPLTYGELQPALVSQVLKQVRAGSGDTLVDIGSGCGVLVLQVELALCLNQSWWCSDVSCSSGCLSGWLSGCWG